MALAAATAAAEEDAGEDADGEGAPPYMAWSPRFTPARMASSFPDSTFQKKSSPA
jgi:hypothetical protein